jgi:hypothetical protein
MITWAYFLLLTRTTVGSVSGNNKLHNVADQQK